MQVNKNVTVIEVFTLFNIVNMLKPNIVEFGKNRYCTQKQKL